MQTTEAVAVVGTREMTFSDIKLCILKHYSY